MLPTWYSSKFPASNFYQTYSTCRDTIEQNHKRSIRMISTSAHTYTKHGTMLTCWLKWCNNFSLRGIFASAHIIEKVAARHWHNCSNMFFYTDQCRFRNSPCFCIHGDTFNMRHASKYLSEPKPSEKIFFCVFFHWFRTMKIAAHR